MKKTSFVMLSAWREPLAALDPKEVGEIVFACYDYHENGALPENLSPAAQMFFAMARPFFDESCKRFDARCETNRKNASKKESRSEANGCEKKRMGANASETKRNETNESEKKRMGANASETKRNETNGCEKKRMGANGVLLEKEKELELELESEQELEFDLEKELELEREREGAETAGVSAEAPAGAAPAPARDPSIPENVKMTKEETAKLKKLFPKKWEEMVSHFSVYLYNHPEKNYRRHFETILDWARRDGRAQEAQAPRSYEIEDFFEAAVKKTMSG